MPNKKATFLTPDSIAALEEKGHLRPETASKMRGEMYGLEQRMGSAQPQILERRIPGRFENMLQSAGETLQHGVPKETVTQTEAPQTQRPRQQKNKNEQVTKIFVSLLDDKTLAAGFAQMQPERKFIPVADMPESVRTIIMEASPIAAGWYIDQLSSEQRAVLGKLRQMGLRERAVREAAYKAAQPQVVAERQAKLKEMRTGK